MKKREKFLISFAIATVITILIGLGMALYNYFDFKEQFVGMEQLYKDVEEIISTNNTYGEKKEKILNIISPWDREEYWKEIDELNIRSEINEIIEEDSQSIRNFVDEKILERRIRNRYLEDLYVYNNNEDMIIKIVTLFCIYSYITAVIFSAISIKLNSVTKYVFKMIFIVVLLIAFSFVPLSEFLFIWDIDEIILFNIAIGLIIILINLGINLKKKKIVTKEKNYDK